MVTISHFGAGPKRSAPACYIIIRNFGAVSAPPDSSCEGLNIPQHPMGAFCPDWGSFGPCGGPSGPFGSSLGPSPKVKIRKNHYHNFNVGQNNLNIFCVHSYDPGDAKGKL